MSEMKYCQGPKCHEYKTKDRIRGPKGDKHYETRKRSSFYYLGGNACSMTCERDWFNKFGEMALRHFGMIHEPKRTDCDSAWYKDYQYNYDHTNNRSNNSHYIANDLLGRRIPITSQQYENCTPDNIKDLVRP
jgi:hypothetical protein